MAVARELFPYERIVDELRAEILTGRRAAGERLPSEHELADHYGTSRPTVRRAVARLKAEGLVVTSQGRGAFVRPKPHVRLLITGGNYRKHRALGTGLAWLQRPGPRKGAGTRATASGGRHRQRPGQGSDPPGSRRWVAGGGAPPGLLGRRPAGGVVRQLLPCRACRRYADCAGPED